MANPQDELCPPPSAEDDELTLPRASMNKIIKELVPTVRVANESRELILNCCTEFIHLISSEANDVCNQRNKKTINAEHVLEALERLGFRDYKQEAETVLHDCKEVAAKRRRQSTRLENLGIPEEELLRQQQELFDKAREEQARDEQQQWMSMQATAVQQSTAIMQRQHTADGNGGGGGIGIPGVGKPSEDDDDDDEDDY
ncbi:protein Dr1 [Scaptodrosophila lebanonensis]|uniref:Protein Dr1 n=1 Tax=Drosophila lebanonensis TaxID=7225 RepID=A0A6J2TM81_DROLE|nr:protein Dr1 [Scaptodrosophila lebanonensis]